MDSLYFINVTRILVFVTSTLSFGCHIAQSAVYLRQAQYKVDGSKTSISNDWISAGHWQYLIWYIALGFSLVCGTIVCLRACICHISQRTKAERYLGIICSIPLFISILTATLSNGQEPWTNGAIGISRPILLHAFSSCSNLGLTHNEAFYNNLYIRCMLSDATLVGALTSCILWLILALLAFFWPPTAHSAAVGVMDPSPLEPTWGRYMPDIVYPKMQHNASDDINGYWTDTKSKDTKSRVTYYPEKVEC